MGLEDTHDLSEIVYACETANERYLHDAYIILDADERATLNPRDEK